MHSLFCIFALMQFLQPAMLWALILVVIPIIVHLFNFRKHKSVYFPTVFFLKEIKEETQKQSKIKHWIVLTSRILALTALIFAFAQPIIPGKEQIQGKKIISIYIDNSFSMESQLEGVSLLEMAKSKALDIVMAYGESDRFQIISNEFSGAQHHIVTKDNALDLIQQIQPCPISRGLDDVFERQKDLLSKNDAYIKKSFMLSDFQKSTCLHQNWTADSTIDCRWIPIQNEISSNIFVDSIWFDIPHHAVQQTETLHVKIKNIGSESKSGIRCEINIQDQNKGVMNLDLDALSETTLDFIITPNTEGIQNGKIILEDYPIVFDNTFYFSYQVDPTNKIGVVFEGNSASQSVFKNDIHFDLKSYPFQQLNYSQFLNQSVLIAENISQPSTGWINATKEAVEKGATLVLIPNAEKMSPNWSSIFQDFELGNMGTLQIGSYQAKQLDFQHPLFANVFDQKSDFSLPLSNARYSIQLNAACQTLVAYEDGTPYLFHRKWKEGEVYVFNCGIQGDKNTLFSHSLFPISLLRMTERAGSDQPLFHNIGETTPLTLKGINLEGNESLKLKNQNLDIIPTYRNINNRVELDLSNGIQTAGNYQIQWGNQVIGAVGINFDASESDTRSYSIEEIEDQIIPKCQTNIEIIEGNIEAVGTEALALDNGFHFWWYLIILSLIFFLLETLLIALWKM